MILRVIPAKWFWKSETKPVHMSENPELLSVSLFVPHLGCGLHAWTTYIIQSKSRCIDLRAEHCLLSKTFNLTYKVAKATFSTGLPITTIEVIDAFITWFLFCFNFKIKDPAYSHFINGATVRVSIKNTN